MPLTPEDVVNKTFRTTQFRRGYDRREVDDFLEEVVATLRRVSGEPPAGPGASTLPAEADDGPDSGRDLRARYEREVALRQAAERALAQLQERIDRG